MGWGLSPWGLSPWGGIPDLYVVDAHVMTERSVRVILSKPPLAESSIADADALNSNSWSIQDLTTGEYLTILVTQMFSAESVVIWTLEPFDQPTGVYRVTVVDLMDQSKNPIVPPVTFDFQSCPYVPVSPVKTAMVDLLSPTLDPGGLVVGSDGDYLVEGGADLIRKLIIRRLTTLPGSFYHAPSFGIGLRVKEKLATSDLVKLRAEIERQVMREPELGKPTVKVTLDNKGILLVEVRATIRPDNKLVTVPVSVPIEVVAL